MFWISLNLSKQGDDDNEGFVCMGQGLKMGSLEFGFSGCCSVTMG